MNILKREKLAPMHMAPGDTMSLSHTSTHGVRSIVLQEEMTRAAVFDEAVIFDLEPGDIPGVADGIGGAFIKAASDGPRD